MVLLSFGANADKLIDHIQTIHMKFAKGATTRKIISKLPAVKKNKAASRAVIKTCQIDPTMFPAISNVILRFRVPFKGNKRKTKIKLKKPIEANAVKSKMLINWKFVSSIATAVTEPINT
jgi:hypothetical protein